MFEKIKQITVFIIIGVSTFVLINIFSFQKDQDEVLIYEDNAEYFVKANDSKLLIFTIEKCPACSMLKEHLDSEGIKYLNLDISNEEKYEAVYNKLGYSTVPVIKHKEWTLLGFHLEILQEILYR
jgi:glutaredoxin